MQSSQEPLEGRPKALPLFIGGLIFQGVMIAIGLYYDTATGGIATITGPEYVLFVLFLGTLATALPIGFAYGKWRGIYVAVLFATMLLGGFVVFWLSQLRTVFA